MSLVNIIVKVLKWSTLGLFGKLSLACQISLKAYKLYLTYKFNKMTEDEKIITIVEAAMKFALELKKDLADKKISLKEAIGIIPETFDLIKLIPDAKGSFEALKDAANDKRIEILRRVCETEGIEGTKAEILIDNVLDIIEKEIDIYEENIKPIIDLF